MISASSGGHLSHIRDAEELLFKKDGNCLSLGEVNIVITGR